MLVEYICLLAVIFLILNFSQSWSSQPVHEPLVTESLLEIVTVSNRSFWPCCLLLHFTPFYSSDIYSTRSPWGFQSQILDFKIYISRFMEFTVEEWWMVRFWLLFLTVFIIQIFTKWKTTGKSQRNIHTAQVWELLSALDYFQKQKTTDFFHQPLPRLERNCSKVSMLFLNFGWSKWDVIGRTLRWKVLCHCEFWHI